MDVIFNIMQVEMSCVIFVQLNITRLLSASKWVGSGQLILLIGQVRVE